MELHYRYNEEHLQIIETANNPDIEWDIKLYAERFFPAIKEIRKTFEENKVYTDVLFYAYDNHHYKIIVRPDYYVDFVLQLMKHQLLDCVEWI